MNGVLNKAVSRSSRTQTQFRNNDHFPVCTKTCIPKRQRLYIIKKKFLKKKLAVPNQNFLLLNSTPENYINEELGFLISENLCR